MMPTSPSSPLRFRKAGDGGIASDKRICLKAHAEPPYKFSRGSSKVLAWNSDLPPALFSSPVLFFNDRLQYLPAYWNSPEPCKTLPAALQHQRTWGDITRSLLLHST